MWDRGRRAHAAFTRRELGLQIYTAEGWRQNRDLKDDPTPLKHLTHVRWVWCACTQPSHSVWQYVLCIPAAPSETFMTPSLRLDIHHLRLHPAERFKDGCVNFSQGGKCSWGQNVGKIPFRTSAVRQEIKRRERLLIVDHFSEITNTSIEFLVQWRLIKPPPPCVSVIVVQNRFCYTPITDLI